MGTDTPLVRISDTDGSADLHPLVPELNHLDLAYSPSSNAVLAHNASMIDLATRDSMVLAIARFDNVTNASGAVSSHLYLTRNADGSQTSWSVVSGVQTAVEAYNLVVSNGAYRDPSGSLVLVAYQYGTRLSVTGLHFFALRLIDGATPADGRIEVSLLQTFTFTNAAVEAQNWAALTPKKARTLTVDSTGQAATVTVSGLGLVDSQFGGGNPRHFLHSFTLSGDGGVYGLSSPWSVETGTVLESILGFEDNGNKVVTLRPSAGATPMVEFAMLSRVNGAVIGTRSTPFAYQTSKNFGTYQPGSGFAFGFIQGTNTAHWLRLWNSDSGTFIGGAFPTLQFKPLNKKYGQLSRIASF